MDKKLQNSFAVNNSMQRKVPMNKTAQRLEQIIGILVRLHMLPHTARELIHL